MARGASQFCAIAERWLKSTPVKDSNVAPRGSSREFFVTKYDPISSENLSGEKVLFALAGATC
jgi:uncharacterized protein YcfJ